MWNVRCVVTKNAFGFENFLGTDHFYKSWRKMQKDHPDEIEGAARLLTRLAASVTESPLSKTGKLGPQATYEKIYEQLSILSSGKGEVEHSASSTVLRRGLQVRIHF